MPLPHLAWIGFIGGSSGLSRVTTRLLEPLLDRWRVTVVQLNRADYTGPLTVVPGQFFHDMLGKLATKNLCRTDPPDVVCLSFDPGPVIEFCHNGRLDVPMCSYSPVDACNIIHGEQLNCLDAMIFLTEFGLTQARVSGYTGPASVIGHGVDLSLYTPHDTVEARQKLGLPPHGFLFGSVAQNQPRKRWDILLYAFREFLRQSHATDTYLYCHCAPRGQGWDIPQLAQYWGISDRVLLPGRPLTDAGVPEALMPWVYSALDVQVLTTQGEGFCLPVLEAMACGTPNIVPLFSALAEWPGDAVYGVNVAYPDVTRGSTNLVEWCVDYREMAQAMGALYTHPAWRESLRRRGLALVQAPQFRWDGLADQLHTVLQEVAAHAAVL